LPTRRLLAILDAIRSYLPAVRRVSSYCLPRNLRRKSVDELRELAAAGLSIAYVGAESGDDEVLERVNKGETFASTVDALDKLGTAGITRSVMILNGLGGPALSLRHAENSARLANATQPEYLATLVVSFPLGDERFRAMPSRAGERSASVSCSSKWSAFSNASNSNARSFAAITRRTGWSSRGRWAPTRRACCNRCGRRSPIRKRRRCDRPGRGDCNGCRLPRCAELIRQADGLLITAGAGIGVDSGLPDFRGPQGFWGVYPALGRARIAFEQIANPAAFASMPASPGVSTAIASSSTGAPSRTTGFAILRRDRRAPAAGRFRVHQQRRRPVPESRFCRRSRRRMPRLDPSPAVPRRLP
jgi:hypothetical protein